MIRIFDIVLNDLLQLRRDFKTFMFLIVMPIIFTLLFGYAFGAFESSDSVSRLPVALFDQDDSRISRELRELLEHSVVVETHENAASSIQDLERLVSDENFAAAILIPKGYGRSVLANKTARLIVYADTSLPAWTTIEAELLTFTNRLDGAVRTGTILEEIDPGRMPFDYGFEKGLEAWDDPPIAVVEATSLVVQKTSGGGMSLAHTSPGMMLQFSIAGLLTAAQVIVAERKSRTLQRLLTTATRRVHILLGHYLAIFSMIFIQFIILISFGQFVLKVDYLRLPTATLLVGTSAAACNAALGLLIGMLARNEEQAATFSIIPMFVFSGIGGAWVPLEFTGEVFRTIGHLSPIAWAMDGFENICARGLGFETVLLPAAALIIYAVFFFSLAVWRFQAAEEK
jgi:ABC-2 type transport system permease protein